MPLVRLQTSAAVASDQREDLLRQLSATTAKVLSKPESYMMVAVADRTPMLMGGEGAPAALLEVRSVGTISGAQARSLSSALSAIVHRLLDVPPDRIYANFTGVEGAMWGHGDRTFG